MKIETGTHSHPSAQGYSHLVVGRKPGGRFRTPRLVHATDAVDAAEKFSRSYGFEPSKVDVVVDFIVIDLRTGKAVGISAREKTTIELVEV